MAPDREVHVRKAIGFLAVVLVRAHAAGSAMAANLQIPPKLLERETRLRASLPAKDLARVETLRARLTPKTTVADVYGMSGGFSHDEIFLVMMDLLKNAFNDAREDRVFSRASAASALAAKNAKLDAEKAKIDASKREAEERFQHALNAATSAMGLGIATGAAPAAGLSPVMLPTSTPGTTKIP